MEIRVDDRFARYPGIVKKHNAEKRYGFITIPNHDRDVFFQANSLVGISFEELREGDRVGLSFEESSRKSLFNAIQVEREWPSESEWPSWMRSSQEAEEEPPKEEVESIVRAAFRATAEWVALQIAYHPNELFHVEWRELEQVLAEIFKALGFVVTLTESSKDGGKDLILHFEIDGRPVTYIVEVKHWSQKKVGSEVLRRFSHVIAREMRDGGLFLSTSGYSDNAFEQLSVIESHSLRCGAAEKVVSLCRIFEKLKSNLWSAPKELIEIIDDKTISRAGTKKTT